MDAEAQKRAAAARALDMVQGGMRLGLGTGSTAKHFVELLGERVRAGLDIVAVPTSEATRAQAAAAGISLTTLDETPELDLTVDGADEIAPDLTLIKGGGGALLREKIVASASAQMIVIADEFEMGIDARPFPAADRNRALRRCRDRAARSKLQMQKPAVRDRWGCGRQRTVQTFVTDGGHWILDAQLQRIPDPPSACGSALQGPRRDGARSVHRSGAGCYRRRA